MSCKPVPKSSFFAMNFTEYKLIFSYKLFENSERVAQLISRGEDRIGKELMGAAEIKVNIDDTYMNIIKFGKGKKCLAIIAGVSLCGLEGHGNAIAERYKNYEEEFTVYVIDRKKILPDGYSVEQMAEDAYRVLNKFGIKKMFLYGVSQGGMIAQCIAAYHPEMVEKMVICASQCRATNTLKGVMKEWIELAEKKDVVGINRSFFKKVYSEAAMEQYKDRLPILEKEGTAEDCDRFKVLVAACGVFDLYDDMDKIKCQTLAIGDTNDKVLGVEGTYEIVDRLNCELYIYKKYSHAVYDEAPDIKERVRAFLCDL